MSEIKKHPRIRTDHSFKAHHPTITVAFREGEEPRRFCGYSWCTGSCGLPAAVLSDNGRGEFKMYSDMTACGPVMQNWRVEWRGERFVIEEEFRETLEKMMWW